MQNVDGKARERVKVYIQRYIECNYSRAVTATSDWSYSTHDVIFQAIHPLVLTTKEPKLKYMMLVSTGVRT